VPLGGAWGGWYVKPRLDLHLVHVRSSGYRESGAGPFNLDVERGSGTTFAAVPAVEVGGRIPLGREAVLRPFASAGVSLQRQPRLGDHGDASAGRQGPGFRVGTPIPDVLGKFTLGAEVLTSSRWDVRVQYGAEVGDRYASHTGMARLGYRF
jgi:outer membrane autotransporter protein